MNPTQSEQEKLISQDTSATPPLQTNQEPVSTPSPSTTPQAETVSKETIVPENKILLEPETPKQSFWQGLGDFSKFAGIVIVCVIVIRYFIAQPFIVSGASMVPNFESSDYLIVDEISYRFHPPQRGDVIIFHPPIDMSTYYIKRVIGLPGDNVSIHNGVVTITNAQHPNGIVLAENYISKDTLVENKTMDVPAGEYFVMGDNRPESFDSRGWGLLPKANITGRALLRLFPVGKISVFPGKDSLVGVDGSTLSN